MSEKQRNVPSTERKKWHYVAAAGAIGVVALASAVYLNTPHGSSYEAASSPERSNHSSVIATVFWIGEAESDDNDQIHNRSSAWIDDWVSAYGGVDDPENRCDYRPCDFTPRENPFYFALPYNDLDENGKQKANAKQIPWYDASKSKADTQLRNHWIKITHDGKTAYAQWGDVGPFGEEDFDYVFGSAKPQEKRAGLDLSPATADYLGVDGKGLADWEFVDENQVPEGPWKEIVTH